MKLIKCDRCGELINPKEEIYKTYKASGEEYDLCGQCGFSYVSLSETLLLKMIEYPNKQISILIGEITND